MDTVSAQVPGESVHMPVLVLLTHRLLEGQVSWFPSVAVITHSDHKLLGEKRLNFNLLGYIPSLREARAGTPAGI